MVDADFAFKVIENPAASDRPYSPNIVMVAGLAGVVSLVLCCLIVVSLDWLRRVRRHQGALSWRAGGRS